MSEQINKWQNNISRQKTKWLLTTSIVLNLFLIGTIAGGAYKLLWSNQVPLSAKVGQNGLRFAADSLSSEQQRIFKKTLREARREAKPLLEASKDARVEVRKQFTMPEFNRDAVAESLARTREADRAVRIKIEESLVSFAATLSAEDRQKLADGLASKGPLRSPPMLKD